MACHFLNRARLAGGLLSLGGIFHVLAEAHYTISSMRTMEAHQGIDEK